MIIRYHDDDNEGSSSSNNNSNSNNNNNNNFDEILILNWNKQTAKPTSTIFYTRAFAYDFLRNSSCLLSSDQHQASDVASIKFRSHPTDSSQSPEGLDFEAI
ncbi:hypothetical protein PoB_002403000 [Plakobranchus ocellatus]|uniref:Uncharacterized protein n=1 Tax=Plakobranchus ocellatus TaxID=259542 RepID=A0AAV3ZSF3_9GAST|nr:hypothetical protein PoB_002403000 [Plakobranchus ocellatus]